MKSCGIHLRATLLEMFKRSIIRRCKITHIKCELSGDNEFKYQYLEPLLSKTSDYCIPMQWVESLCFDKIGLESQDDFSKCILFTVGYWRALTFDKLNLKKKASTFDWYNLILIWCAMILTTWCLVVHSDDIMQWICSNLPVNSPYKMSLMQSCGAFCFDIGLSRLWNKQLSCYWFGMPWQSVTSLKCDLFCCCRWFPGVIYKIGKCGIFLWRSFFLSQWWPV